MKKHVIIWLDIRFQDELVKPTFSGGKHNESKFFFDRVEELYNDLIKEQKTYLYDKFNPVVANEDENINPMSVHLILKLC